MPAATFRFYEELNDFLPAERKRVAFDYAFDGRPSVKDTIEAIGVPHTEIDLILVNGASVDFGHLLQAQDRVAVYPAFEAIDITPVRRLRPGPLREPRFIVDVNLGKLARLLRMLGFDTLFARGLTDGDIAAVSRDERRIILTKDRGLLKRSAVTHGTWVRAEQPREQLIEVIRRLDLSGKLKPLSRCITCNGMIAPVSKESVLDVLPPRSRELFTEFFRCSGCGQVFWKGSHYENMIRFIDDLKWGVRAEQGRTLVRPA